MKQYVFEEKSYDKLPDPLKTSEGAISPMTEQRFMDLGGLVVNDDQPTPEEEFAASAAKFRTLCDDIGQFIGDPSFTGGFDEVVTFNNSHAAQADPMTAYALALRWMELNEECKYKGAKIGLGQPEWFYRCWELAAEEQTEA
ncbi:MAG: hypothetical protein IJT68_10315 [Lentisphaeria bacterium]|nr:hypothetical protein [Lentisphaeria bacterium]MBR3507113.1 hypothetical protein [Lentisphaeria bacterium]